MSSLDLFAETLVIALEQCITLAREARRLRRDRESFDNLDEPIQELMDIVEELIAIVEEDKEKEKMIDGWIIDELVVVQSKLEEVVNEVQTVEFVGHYVDFKEELNEILFLLNDVDGHLRILELFVGESESESES